MSELRPTGAVRRQSGLRRFRHKHRSALRAACARLAERPLAHAFALGLLAIALFALLLLRLGMDQFQHLSSPLAGARSLSLFLDPGADEGVARRLAAELSGDPRVGHVELVSPAEGLAELSRLGGSEEALATLPGNPLPWVLAVEPVDRDAGSGLVADWNPRPEVEYLADEHEWQARADVVLAAAGMLGWVLMVVVGLAAVLLAANAVRTIRIEGAEERALQRVFGASETDLRRPYVYLGLLYGLIAGTLAVLLLTLVLWPLSPVLAMLAEVFGTASAPLRDSLGWLAASVPLAAALGAFGAWLGCRFEPDLEAME